jgi:two-component system, chemotaxis family, chemotaxis protein CheY
MSKRVLDVGQCAPDHAVIRRYLTTHFDAEVVPTHGLADTLGELRSSHVDLVLINRKLDADYSDGIEIVRAIKAAAQTKHVPVMLVTNYPEHQDAAEAAGAHRGFGKLEFDRPETKERLAAILAPR